MPHDPSASAASQSRLAALRTGFRSLGLSRAVFLRQLWLRPLVAVAVLAAVGWFMNSALERVLKEDLESSLQTLLTADVTALEIWMRSEQDVARSVAKDAAVISHVEQMIAHGEQPEVTQLVLLKAPEQEALRAELRPHLESHGYNGFVVVNRRGRIVASQRNDAVGLILDDQDLKRLLDRVWAGGTAMTRPAKSVIVLPDETGKPKAGLPTMFAVAPVRSGDASDVIAALALRIRPQQEFTEILSVARMGQTGETYAFDRDGLLLSGSRFDPDLKQIGLLTEDATSILNISIRDPGVDLTAGQRAARARSEQPLTKMAAAAVAGKPGADVNGYRDYRGVPVVGAWTWLDEYGIGVVTEIDRAEAYRSMIIVRTGFWVLFALLTLTATAIAVSTAFMGRLKRQTQRAVLEARQLGQYTLDQKLGEGGMGVVYRAHHAMLHRPTAVKFLHPDRTTDETVARFEREVQLTSKLTHPNTIAVYDFGRTPEGVFYYAMEYLDGINLEKLVHEHGPLPDGRVIYLLRQACGSLAEAHEAGLIHRDIKPANIVVNARGGLYDLVKVLDFGLARAVDQRRQARVTATGTLAGTPLYMSPEAIDHPDAVGPSSDLYALAAVGYYLLTGTPLFDGESILEILEHHRSTPPEPPSQRLGKPVSTDLTHLLLSCLAKRPEDRPASARALAAELAKCAMVFPWTDEDAAQWWRTCRPSGLPPTASGLATSAHIDTTIDATVAFRPVG